MSALDSPARKLRDAYGQFVTGIAVVTTMDEDSMPIGLTINSFSSVSLDPPLVLWSLRKDSGCLPVFQHSNKFAINVLAHDQKWICERFARSSNDKFSNLPYEIGCVGSPTIDGSIAQFECVKVHEYAGGDHVIFVGEVMNFRTMNKSPLIFHAGNYSIALTEEEVA